MAVVGGLGTLAGPVLGAVVFTYLPEKLQIFAEYQFMVYGLILLLSFVLLPRGLAGLLLPRPRFAKDVAPLPAAPPAAPKPSGSGPLLSAEAVSISFLGLRALDNASVTVGAGEILGLVGPNGSGKSTLVNIISGIYRPGDGRVTFDGAAITGLPDHAVARRGALRTFQDPRLVPAFTVRENVLLGGHRLYRQNPLAAALNLPGALREDAAMLGRADAIIAMAGLSHLADTPVRDLPYGDQRMTELSRVILADPRLVMLDEPAAGLSEVELQRLGGLVRHLKERGVGVILIEHHMDFLNELVDRVVVLDSGRVIYQGGMAGMYRDPAVVAAYLGTETHPGEAVHA
ncbi:ABC transporter ATP-binding protein [Azospirillum argentinense]|uniref:ABC transporter ATP-binding protein n=1 Tax=Azospirillum argentinense TaxID=2970906 RepID=UPI001FFE9537|nr:ABC transporter ATP-binding protein [Azospirillum argentinense]